MAQSKGITEILEELPRAARTLAAGVPKHPSHRAAVLLATSYACLGLVAFGGCAAAPRPYPWNFPDAQEWNQPLETSWQNAVDTYRRVTAPKYKIWDPLMQNYQPDFGKEPYEP